MYRFRCSRGASQRSRRRTTLCQHDTASRAQPRRRDADRRLIPTIHSCRSAVNGSTRLARIAGITIAATAITASVPGASKEVFDKAAADAKGGCPISKLFANNTEITLDAKLV